MWTDLRKLLALGVILGLTLVGCLKTREQIRGGGEQLDDSRQVLQGATPSLPPALRQDEMDAQMRQLNGRIEVLERDLELLKSVEERLQVTLSQNQERLEGQIRALEEAIKKLEAQLIEARADQHGRRTDAAQSAPKSSFEAAEDLFTKKQWKEAILNYQKYRDANPKGRHYAQATFKIGACFEELKMRDEARAFYDEVVVKFPKSNEAKKAQQRLKTLR